MSNLLYGGRAAPCQNRRASLLCPQQRLKVAVKSLSRRQDGVEDTISVKPNPRTSLRMGLPSKGRMAEDSLILFKDSALSVYKPNPRQYVARIPQIPQLEIWFQRASDVVRKLQAEDIDLGIVGTDMFTELAYGDDDLIVVHEALSFGECHLGLGVPITGKFADIRSLDQLKDMPDWTEETPLRVVTSYTSVAKEFFKRHGFEHVAFTAADGALEAAPAMGSADIILDLVSTGVTLRENNLREIEGGNVLESQGMLVANKKSLLARPGLLKVVHELIERFDAHLNARSFYSVIANMRGESPEEVALVLLNAPGLRGLQGPTISPVYHFANGHNGSASNGSASNGSESGSDSVSRDSVAHGYYAATICVHKKKLYPAVKALRQLGGSNVLVQPMTYIFDEEPRRWTELLQKLGLDAGNYQMDSTL